MNNRRQTLAPGILISVLVLIPFAVHGAEPSEEAPPAPPAATVCKGTTASGKVIYGDCNSMPAGSKQEKIDIDLNRNVIPADRPIKPVETDDQTDAPTATPPKSATLSKRQRAEQELREAREALEAGQKTQPGDFMGKAGGGVRPSMQRLNRIKELQDRVEAAEKKLEAL